MELFFDTNLIAKKDVIAVAFSGGKDSVALLHALISYAKKFDFTVKAINVEHGIRGDESKRDTEFCKKVAKDYNIEIKTYSVDTISYSTTNKLSIEEGARKLRYDCFYKAIDDGFCQKIALAHHESDQVETVLFNLFRGTSITGAGGIKPISPDNRLIRPLLRTKQDDILKYVEFHKLSFVSDSTNENTDYTRNFLRHKIIPLVKDKFCNAEENICNFSELAKSDDEYLYALAQKEIIFEGERAKVLKTTEYPLLTRAIKIIFQHFNIKKDYTKKHIDSCVSLAEKTTGAKIDLPLDIVAVREYDYLVFYKKTNKTHFLLPFSLGVVETDNFIITLSKITQNEYNNEKKLPYKSINGENFSPKALYCDYSFFENSILRHPSDSDIFEKFGGGTKTLNKYLIDKKIPSAIRNKLIVISKKDKILAVLGVEISECVKITDKTTSILKITCEKK